MDILTLGASFKRYEGYSLEEFYGMIPFEVDAYLYIIEELRRKDEANRKA